MEIPVFHAHFDGSAINPNPPTIKDYKQLNDFQEESYEALFNSLYGIVNAPTGKGKSLFVENDIYCHLSKGDFKHAIILAPQTIITDQYGYNKFINSNGNKILWNVPKSNIYGISGKPISNLTKNLENNPTHIMDGVHLATHAGFIKWFFENEDHRKLLHDCLIVVDEVHHAMYDEHEGEEIHNQLGEVKKWIFEQEDVGFLGMSATLFRSDGLKIVPEKYRDKVTFYHYDYSRYLQGFEYLKTFDYDILYYDEVNPLKRIKDVHYKHGFEKEIIYLPYVGSRYCWDSKAKQVSDIFKTIGTNIRKDRIFTLVTVNGVERKYIDLVDERQRKAKKQYLKGDCSDLDGIITLGMAKEGFDWEQCQRLIVLGARTSIVEIHQTYGRLTRASGKDKTRVCLYHILPKPITGNIEESTNEYLLNFYFARQYGELMMPLSMIVPDPGKGKYIKGLGIPKVRLLPEVLRGDMTACAEFKIECERQLGDFTEASPESSLNKKKKKFQEIVQSVFENEYGVTDKDLEKLTKDLNVTVNWEKIAKQCWVEWTVATFRVRYPGKPIDWSIVNEMSPDEDIRWYNSKICNEFKWEEFSRQIKPYDFYSYEESKKIVKSFNINKQDDYYSWKKSNNNNAMVPYSPNEVYKEEWIDWYDFFGKEKPDEFYNTLKECKNVVNSFKFKSKNEFEIWRKSKYGDKKIPTTPYQVYKEEWIDWYDFFGNEKPDFFKTLEECKRFVQSFCLKTQKEFYTWKLCEENKYNKVPRNPYYFYQEEWIDWYDFFDKEKPDEFYNTLKECKDVVNSFKFKSNLDFKNWVKSETGDKRIPIKPNIVYKEEWIDWYDFLKNEEKCYYLTLEECKLSMRKYNIKNRTQFNIWIKSKERDHKVSTNPHRYYVKNGWIDWYDFFNKIKPNNITVNKILQWSDEWFKKYNKWPNRNSGNINETNNWKTVNTALINGLRGLKKGQSLAQLLEKERGVRNNSNLPDLSIDQIYKWREDFFILHKKYPIHTSGKIDGTEESWSKIHYALVNGKRGLPLGSSLYRL